jgi:hypothetical protein
MVVIEDLKEKVRDFLLASNGTMFLNMADDGKEFPTALCGKKKYFSTTHASPKTINFYPKVPSIKGIDIIKQGQAPITKTLGMEFIREALSVENERELIDISDDKIRKFYTTKPDPKLFVLNARYKPLKKNVSVLRFVARMVENCRRWAGDPILSALYAPPEPGDKFEYVVVNKGTQYTLQGNRIDLKKGDQMEYLLVFIYSQTTNAPMEINFDYYVKNVIVGLFSRFIAYHPNFQPVEGEYDLENDEQAKAMDKHCIASAKKYLVELCGRSGGRDSSALTEQGRNYRKIYTRADKYIRADVITRNGPAGTTLRLINVHNDETDNRALSTQIVEQIKQLAEEHSVSVVGRAFVHEMNRLGVDVFRLRNTFSSTRGTCVSKIRLGISTKRKTTLIEALYRIIPRAARVINSYEKRTVSLIDDMRLINYENEEIAVDDSHLSKINTLDGDDQIAVQTLHELIVQFIAVSRFHADTLSITDAIAQMCARAVNDYIAPARTPREETIGEMKAIPVIEDYQWT